MSRWFSRFRNVIALLSLMLAGTVLGLTVGLWESSARALDELVDVVGRHTWLVQQELVGGVQPPPLPARGPTLERLQALPGVQGLALQSSITRGITEFSYPSNRVSASYFDVRRHTVVAGRAFQGPEEAVVGADLGELLDEVVTLDGEVYQVVGVLEPVSEREGWLEANADAAVYLPLEGYQGLRGSPVRMFLEVAPEHFEATGPALVDWLAEEGLEGYEVLPLAELYGLELRERTARLLGGALGFGLAATLLTTGANLTAFYLAQALARVRQLGVRRALGATRGEAVREEVLGALPWALAGLALSLPVIFLAGGWFERVTSLAVQPGPVTLAVTMLSLLALVGLAAWGPAVWAAALMPAQAIRGLLSTMPQRRLWLAAAGLTLGVAGLILQASTARSAEAETERLIGRYGERVGMYSSSIYSAEQFNDPRAQANITPQDYGVFLDAPLSEKFSRIGYMRLYSSRLEGPMGEGVFRVKAYEGDLPELAGLELTAGRMPEVDAEEAMLGISLAEDLFGRPDPLGEQLELFGREWQVVGVFRGGVRQIPGGVSSAEVLLPGALVFARGGGEMLVEVAPGLDIDEVLAEGAAFLSERHPSPDLKPFSPLRPLDFAPPIRETLDSLSAAYRVLALALLLLGGAGLAAQMLVSLSLRVKEIGIRRATGASQGAVFYQFLGEGLRLALLAGLAGVLLGVGASYLAARVQEVSFALDVRWLALAVLVALLVAALFGALPAHAASRIPPARAMREGD